MSVPSGALREAKQCCSRDRVWTVASEMDKCLSLLHLIRARALLFEKLRRAERSVGAMPPTCLRGRWVTWGLAEFLLQLQQSTELFNVG